MAPASLRFLVIDDDPIVPAYEKQALKQAFHGSSCESVGTVWEGKQRLSTPDHSYSLVLLDLLLPDGSGVDILDFIKADPRMRSVPVIITSGVSDRSVASQCRASGARGYIPRMNLPIELITAVRTVLAGDEYFQAVGSGVAHLVPQRASDEPLPLRLASIAERLGKGKSPKEVAADLDVPEINVRNALPDLMRFFSVSTRGELMRVLASKYGGVA
jgi:two-component system response regulator EvgA